MAISNYTELQAAVASWAHRSTSNITDFIALAEKRINAALESRMADVESDLVGVADSRYISLPSGYYNNLGLWIVLSGFRKEIVYVNAQSMPIIEGSPGQPTYYTIDGSNIAFNIENSEAYDYVLRYKKGYDIASTSTNDILTRYPNVYLYSSLREASLFANDDNNAAKWETAYQMALEECSNAEFKNKTLATLGTDTPLTFQSGVGSRNIFIDGAL